MRNPFQERFEEYVNESTYVTRSLHGDRGALEALVLRHQSWIYNIAFSMMNDIHDAEDATQEVLIKVITKLSTYDPRKASFRTWLYRIVVNHIINMRENRKEKTMSELMKSRGIDEYAARIPDTRKSIHYDEFISLSRDQPFFTGPDMVQWLSDLIKGRNFQELIHATRNGDISSWRCRMEINPDYAAPCGLYCGVCGVCSRRQRTTMKSLNSSS
jgi:RNA polymerase sigma factor (sigma-70 family)